MIRPEDVEVIRVRNPETDECFDVRLDRELAVEVAAFCTMTGASPVEVFTQALARFLDDEKEVMDVADEPNEAEGKPAEAQPDAEQQPADDAGEQPESGESKSE